MLIDLPASAQTLQPVIQSAYAWLPSALNSRAASVELTAIALQESGLVTRQQFGGPAHGLWQFELGGVALVAKSPYLTSYLTQHAYPASPVFLYGQIKQDDVLACLLARMTLWSDPRALPTDEEGGWEYYIRNWRPGKPSRIRWTRSWKLSAVI